MAVLLGERCNPYGAESGGPRRLLGGLYGPRSAVTPGMDLPQAAAEGEWVCEQPAQVRVRMVCRHGHRGQVMPLCAEHDEESWVSEFGPGGTIRRVSTTVRVLGHLEMIARRQAGFCPPCGFPDSRASHNRVDYAALQKEWEAAGRSMYELYSVLGPRARLDALFNSLNTRREDIGALFDEGRRLGIVHNCPLTLVPVS